jgi:hypothetical protein
MALAAVWATGCAQGTDTGAFVLTAAALPGDSFYQSLIRSEQPGLAYFSTRERYQGGNATAGTALLQVDDGGELTHLKTVAALPDGHRPRMLLEDDGILYNVTRSKPDEDYFSGLDLVAEDGTRIEVLHDNKDNPFKLRGLPRYHYDQDYGLVLFIVDGTSMTVWDNSTRTETQTIKDVVFAGSGFVNGKLRDALVTRNGEPLLFAPEQGMYVDAPELQWLGLLAAEWDSERDRIQNFVFSEKLAAARSGEFVRLIDQDGNRFGVKLQDAGEYQLNGRPRSDEEYLLRRQDLLHYKEEGKTASPTIVGSATLLPLDNERIAILDKSYQRMVIVAPADSQ